MVMSKGRRRRRKSIRFGRIVGVIIALLAIILLFLPLSMEDKTIEVEVGTEFTDEPTIKYLGFNVSKDVKITGNVDTSKVGEYKITYKWGLKSATRTINVIDTTAPVIDMQGGSTLYVEDFNNLESLDPGVIVTDNYDEDVKAKRERHKISDSEYEFVYTATDSSGNITIAKRTIMKTTGVIYLTFDDGPSDITPEVLDILQENEIKATFFIVDYSEEDKSKIQRIIDEGHTLGLHGLSHDYAKIYSSVDAITENFIGLQEKILNDFDYNAIYIRFPGGASNTISKKYCDGVMTAATSKVEQEGFTYYDWNVDVNDAGSARTANKVYDNFVAGIVPQRENVVLMHDGYGHQPTADALQKIIDYAKENGYVFSEITEETIPVQHGVNN